MSDERQALPLNDEGVGDGQALAAATEEVRRLTIAVLTRERDEAREAVRELTRERDRSRAASDHWNARFAEEYAAKLELVEALRPFADTVNDSGSVRSGMVAGIDGEHWRRASALVERYGRNRG